MQENQKKEINSMQHCLMTIKEKDDKVIKDMEANQICLQKKLLTMEEDHTREISAIKVEHSSQINQEPSHLSQQAPSYYEEVIGSIERWLIEGDPDKLKNDKDQMQDEEKDTDCSPGWHHWSLLVKAVHIIAHQASLARTRRKKLFCPPLQ